MMPSNTPDNLVDLQKLNYPIADLRSDVVTKPTPAMREAMFKSEVGDDVAGEDPTTNALEERVARLFKKDKAIFLPTGTMGNIIAVLAHCDRRVSEIFVGDESFTFLHEQCAFAQFGGIHMRTLPNSEDGTFDLDGLEAAIEGQDEHALVITLVSVENTHNMCGGKVLPIDWLRKLGVLARKYKIPVHMDGARLFNAAVHSGLSVAEITADCDSVQFCFSKGLGCPIGSMLVGSQQFIFKARWLRNLLGAGMAQVGVLTAPCNVALDVMVDRLADDHANARLIAQGITDLNCPAFSVNIEKVHTNILMIDFNTAMMTAPQFCTRLAQVTKDEDAALADDVILVRCIALNMKRVRLVTHNDVTRGHVEKLVKKLHYISSELNTA